MPRFQNILAVIQSNGQAQSVIGKAIALSDAKVTKSTRIHAVRIIYEGLAELSVKDIDKSSELKNFILTSEKNELQKILAEVSPLGLEIESSVIWNRRFSEGVCHAAEAVGADLIVKATEDGDRGLIRTPDDWNILRESKTPVLLARPADWHYKPTILVAIDALDETHKQLNQDLLSQAAALALQLPGQLHVCTFYPLFEPWSTRLGLLQHYKELRRELEHEVAVAVNRLARSIGAPNYTLQCIEGDPEFGIERLTHSINADIVVIGNRARDGLAAALIGNTAEKILYRTQTDILTIV